ncbi:peptidylprolyl isomerase [Luteimonas qiangzhengi]
MVDMSHRRFALPVLPLLASTLLAAMFIAVPVTAEEPLPPTMGELLASSSADDWRELDADNTLYLELDAGRVIIELAPDFAPAHAENLRTLAREHFWDGLAIYRSHDNFVVQWGDPAEGDARRSLGNARDALPAEFERNASGLDFLDFHRLPDADGWAPEVGFAAGFPAARDPATGKAWLAHCYGMVGAGRGAEPDSSIGTELYAVTGQSPRQLDRNITVVGRVVDGIELLSPMPRGSGPLGFYEDPAQRTPIRTVRLASDVPESGRTPLQLLRTDTPLFDAVVESRRNRRDGWYLHPAGHIDLCNVPLPTRLAGEG